MAAAGLEAGQASPGARPIEQQAPKRRRVEVREAVEDWECPICAKPSDALTACVPCGHTIFCEDCSLRWWQSESLANRNVRCPVCRAELECFVRLRFP